MMQIPCPHCGPRAQIEFAYGRSLDSLVTPDMDGAAAMGALYARANPKGLSDELWRHTYGCGQWLVLRRHTVTHEIIACVACGEALPEEGKP